MFAISYVGPIYSFIHHSSCQKAAHDYTNTTNLLELFITVLID